MRVSDIQIIPSGDECELRGRVESDIDPDDAQWFAPFDLWYRFPLWCEPYLSPLNGDPFLAALLLTAMRIGERLVIAAPVSARLIEALPDLQAIYACFDSHNARVAVEVTARDATSPTDGDNAGVGLFFSLGVDSFHSLLKNQRDHPDDAKSVSHLISAHGFDVAFDGWDETFPPALLANFQRVAHERGKTLIPVATNVRRVTERLAPWTLVHGGAMASIALALGGGLRRALIAASTTYDKLYPWGSHPVLDPLWSTEQLTVVHDGCEVNTIDKTGIIAGSDLVLETLRPCAGYGPGYNCGQCLKCLRTMLDLLQFGALDRCPTLPHEIDPERLRGALRPGGPVHVADFQRRLDALRRVGGQQATCDVLEEHLAQGMASRWTPNEGRGGSRFAQPRHMLEGIRRRVGR